MEFCLIIGSICVVLGGLLIPFHKKVKAEKFHAYAFLVLGVLVLIAPFVLGLGSFSDLGIPLEVLLSALFFLLLLVAIPVMIYLFKDGNKKGGIIFAIVTAVLVVGLIAAIALSPKPDTGMTDAIVFAENAVEERLKSPSTAEFSPPDETNVEKVDDDTYIVTGWVDAQNSFGATIRNYYEVKLIINSENNATLVYCDIDT